MDSSARSRASRPTPARTPARGEDKSGASPSIRMDPSCGIAPKRARPISSWPAPLKPTKPMSSPSRMSKSTGPAPDGPRRPWSALALVEELERGTAHNEAYELVGIGLAHGLLADEASVAHHHDPVGDAKNLVEAMRDIDHADAPAPQAAHRVEQTLDLVGRQARRRLVEHEKIAIDDQRAGDRDQRLLSPAQASHASARIDPASDQCERLFGAALGARPVDRREGHA